MRKKNPLTKTIILTAFCLSLTSCETTSPATKTYTFPSLGGERSEVDEKGNVTEFDKDGNTVFYYDRESDTVTLPYWYFKKLVEYGIDTGGL